MESKTAVVLGAGLNIGAASVRKFKESGFKVAAVARNPLDEVKSTADLVLSADFSDPACFAGIFEQVEKELGVASVVIYNRMVLLR